MIKQLPEGFNCYREHFMWGRTDGYIRQNDEHKTEYLFKIPGSIGYMTGKEVYDMLQETWRPVAQDEQIYFAYRMRELAGLLAPRESKERVKEEAIER